MSKTEYVLEDAASFVGEAISDQLAERLSYADICVILETEFEWQRENGHLSDEMTSDSDMDLEMLRMISDQEKMEYYIIQKCVQKGIILTYDDLMEILGAETDYLESLGLIEETDESPEQWLN
ncbi:MAG TPA: hypothetical protein PKW80_11995 [Bacteroidales bacterium]|nr:hypothetical protein [Bacteroidales bacterium]